MQGLQKKFGSKIKKKNSLFAEGQFWLSAKKLFAEGQLWLSAKELFAESQSGMRSAKVAGLGPALSM